MAEYLALKQQDCRSCYKCIRHCPVKSIRFFNNQAHIIEDECILCGRCFVACPQRAKEIRNDTAAAATLLESGSPVYASLAPSFVAAYRGMDIAAMEAALKALGFAGVEETAIGAALVKKQYDAMVDREDKKVIISTCCPTVNLLVQKYYPGALPYLAAVLSPMQVHCMDIKRRHAGAKTVFIGPCISKKSEAEMYPGPVDCVLTFVELSQWLGRKNIGISMEKSVNKEKGEEGLTRLFPITGGILRSMEKNNPAYTYLAVDGIENCIKALEDVAAKNLEKCFIEMSACSGSCIGGPVMTCAPVRDYLAVHAYAGKKDFTLPEYGEEKFFKKIETLAVRRVHLGSKSIEEVLNKLGKTKPEHELNCGSCGYSTCREKAQAVLEGKATLTMCLPYLKEKAESFSDTIIKNTPNAIIVLNENFEVQEINAAACKLLHLASPQYILGDQVVRILDPMIFMDVYQNQRNIYNKHFYLADYQKHVEETIIYDKSSALIICIMRDISDEISRREAKEKFDQKAIEITDKVIEKQMLAVQEIASLLGETTAETKIALTKLKESLTNE
jgi:iron only hydrogenase large subunit-like protein/uncharacterized Fe-S cluster-containing protein